MGFRSAKRRVVQYLEEGRFEHWPRKDAFRKNWLEAGRISTDEVGKLLNRCHGKQHKESQLFDDPSIPVHEFKPHDGTVQWYIKVFFDSESDLLTVMSVHPSGD